MDFKAHQLLSTLKIDEGSSRLGVHKDPPTPMPALLFGRGLFTTGPQGCGPSRGQGGRLFLANGLVDISYGPYDVCLLDGNFEHAVTTLRDLPGAKSSSRPELTRFSGIIFNRFAAEKRKADYSSDWREEWWERVPWKEGFSNPRNVPRLRKAPRLRV